MELNNDILSRHDIKTLISHLNEALIISDTLYTDTSIEYHDVRDRLCDPGLVQSKSGVDADEAELAVYRWRYIKAADAHDAIKTAIRLTNEAYIGY